MKSKEWRQSTKETSLARAKDVAEGWYLELCAKDRFGELKSGKTFAQAAAKFEEEYEAITQGRRSPKWVQGHKDRIRLHLKPFFGNRLLCEITEGLAQEYRVHRMTPPKEKGANGSSGASGSGMTGEGASAGNGRNDGAGPRGKRTAKKEEKPTRPWKDEKAGL